MASPPQQPPAAPPAETIDPDALRIVLFGMPDAGKSSLLGALAQAAQSQERALQGRLTDLTEGLAELRSRVYDDRPRETLEEVVPYPVSFEPYSNAKPDPAGRTRAVLYDCDGRVANELLASRLPVGATPTPDGGLAQAIQDADALVLVIDASAPPEQIDTDLREFVRFLRLLQQARSDRTEVGGLPVYLVLSKCDLLGGPDVTYDQWQARIAEREREVERRFREFLAGAAEDGDEGPVFGSIDLHVVATAVRRPELAGVRAQPREPFGVAELFHDALGAARDFRERTHRSGRRLAWVVGTVGTLVAGMAALALALAIFREPTRVLPVASQVESYRAREGQTPSARLAEPLQRKISELTEIVSNPDFNKLPPEDQAYVKARLDELTEYQQFKEKLEALRPPADRTTREELDQLTRQLQTELRLPEKYKDEWRETSAAHLRDKYLTDARLLKEAVGRLVAWYRFDLIQPAIEQLNNIRENRERSFADWTAWLQGVGQLFDRAKAPPFDPAARVPGSPTLPGPRGEALTYRPAFRFREVEQAAEEWDGYRRQLERLRDLTTALGLLGDDPQKAPLKFPETLTPEDVAERAASLRRQYPQAEQWSLTELPPFARPQVAATARASYQRLLGLGQQLVLQQLQQLSPDGRETHARWLEAADWLTAAPELRPWRDLAKVLTRLADGTATDPAAELANFLRRDRFTLDLNGAGLRVPFDVPVPDGLPQRLTPSGKLTVYQRGAGGERSLSFHQEGPGSPRDRSTLYRFLPDGETSLDFRPGDQVWAVLPVTDGTGKTWSLTWSRCRSQQYEFERLVKEPFVHAPPVSPPQGRVADGVGLSFAEGAIPRVPDLMPPVTLKAR
jgi:hypothetical protein